MLIKNEMGYGVVQQLRALFKEELYDDSISSGKLEAFIALLKNTTDISKTFFEELESFVKRNSILIKKEFVDSIYIERIACLRCFKAHVNSTGHEFGLSDNTINFFTGHFACDKGHNGYYIDQGNIKSVD